MLYVLNLKKFMIKKKFNFVYISTNLINGKQYVGDHSTNNLNDNYLGSGTYLSNAKNKYGKKNFHRKILKFFNTKQKAFNAQEEFINQFNTLKPNGYNISPKGGHGIRGCWSEESKNKLSKSNKGRIFSEEHKKKLSGPKSEETKQNMKEAWKKRRINHPITKETRRKISKANKGRKRSLESRKKMALVWLGRHHSEESKEKNRQSHLGKKHTEEAKAKIAKKFKCTYCGREMNIGNLNRWHNENCKFKPHFLNR